MRIRQTLSKQTTALILSTLLVLVFQILFSFFLIPSFVTVTEGERPLEMVLFYSPEEALRFMANYQEEGRQLYRSLLLLDLFYPLVYGGCLLLWFTKLGAKPLFLPGITVVFDYLENAGIFFLLGNHEGKHAFFVARLTSYATLGKTLGLVLCLLLFFFSLLKRKREAIIRR